MLIKKKFVLILFLYISNKLKDSIPVIISKPIKIKKKYPIKSFNTKIKNIS